MDQYGNALDLREFALGFIEPVAVTQLHAVRQPHALVARQVVGRDDYLSHAFGGQLRDKLWNTLAADDVLPAGHRDRTVHQQLVGDVGIGGDAGADRQAARVVVGTVAEVLHEMLVLDVTLHAGPQLAFAAHLAQADVGADFFLGACHGQRRAADPHAHQRAFGHDSRAVVRTARAEVGGAVHDRLDGDRGARQLPASSDPGADRQTLDVGQNTRRNRRGDDAGRQI